MDGWNCSLGIFALLVVIILPIGFAYLSRKVDPLGWKDDE